MKKKTVKKVLKLIKEISGNGMPDEYATVDCLTAGTPDIWEKSDIDAVAEVVSNYKPYVRLKKVR